MRFPNRTNKETNHPERVLDSSNNSPEHDHNRSTANHSNSTGGPTTSSGSKTFLKPFVRGVANAGRNVGAGISHAGKVVDVLTDLTDRISLPRPSISTSLSGPDEDQLVLAPTEISDAGGEDKKEKLRKRGVFRKAGIALSSPNEFARESSVEMSRENSGPITDNNSGSRRVNRSITDYTGFSPTIIDDEAAHQSACSDDELIDTSLQVESNDVGGDNDGTDDQPKHRNNTAISVRKKRHSIQIPSDYYHLSVRHTIRKQNLEVQMMEQYRKLKARENQLRKVVEEVETLEALFRSTAIDAECKARHIKDRLEKHVSKGRISPQSSYSEANAGGGKLSDNISPDTSPTVGMMKGLSWEKVEPEIWRLYKELNKAGEVIGQRREEVAQKRKMLEDHVDSLIFQAGLSKVSNEIGNQSDDGPSSNQPGPTQSIHPQNGQQSSIESNQERQTSIKNHYRNETETENTVEHIVEGLFESIKRDPSVKIAKVLNVLFKLLMICMEKMILKFSLGLKWWIEFVLISFQNQLEHWTLEIQSKRKENNDQVMESIGDQEKNQTQ